MGESDCVANAIIYDPGAYKGAAPRLPGRDA
jgi:hypothetical protein